MPATDVLLLTPPFTQLNTPYPATAYLKGFLRTRGISAVQADLGLEVILDIFSKKGLQKVFDAAKQAPVQPLNDNSRRILALRDSYLSTIEPVIAFLQGKNPMLAHRICQEHLLPEASRFDQITDMEWAFGAVGIQDKAKHLATLYLEDLSDLIQHGVDPDFGFSRYAERLGRCAETFDALYTALQQPPGLMEKYLTGRLQHYITTAQPLLVAVSVPFPGNLFGAFRCAQWIKKHHPHIRTVMGGGFVNTELRSVSDARVFEFFDFIALDDGEAPLEHLVQYLRGERTHAQLKRTFSLLNGVVTYCDLSDAPDYPLAESGTPDYSDLWLDRYISVLELTNPMHRMWSDGRWNKLTMARGCYWGKCTFCDISLPYISEYEPVAATMLCDRMEEIIAQTGESSFHFVDEAAPPALMRALALEILRRGLIVTWWTNIRFEKSFTADLCTLLRASGCVAVSGGLEVASDRLLALIQKGVTVEQVAHAAKHFSDAGILVHAYLMYGFPTQTAQETIDSLEMVRQMFEAGVIQSGYWHRFAMTAHSPVGLRPDDFKVRITSCEKRTFADNDLFYEEPGGANHEAFSLGLKKSLLNYMHGIGLDAPLQSWFDFKTPRPQAAPLSFSPPPVTTHKSNAKVIWLGAQPELRRSIKRKKGREWDSATLFFHHLHEPFDITFDRPEGAWLAEMLPQWSVCNEKVWTIQETQQAYAAAGLGHFELFWYGKSMSKLYAKGLLIC